MNFLIYALAVWRLSHMLVKEDGPAKALAWLRGVAKGSSISPLGCVSCTSVWVAAALPLCPLWVRSLFAASAVAKLVDDYFYGAAETVEDEGLQVAVEPASWPGYSSTRLAQ